MHIIPKKASNVRIGLVWKCRLIKVPRKNRSHPLIFSLSLIILEQSLICATESSREKNPLPQVRHTCSEGSPATCNGLSVIMTCSSFASWLLSSVLNGGWSQSSHKKDLQPVLRIRIRQIRMFLGLLDPDPDSLVRGMDPDLDPSIIKQK